MRSCGRWYYKYSYTDICESRRGGRTCEKCGTNWEWKMLSNLVAKKLIRHKTCDQQELQAMNSKKSQMYLLRKCSTEKRSISTAICKLHYVIRAYTAKAGTTRWERWIIPRHLRELRRQELGRGKLMTRKFGEGMSWVMRGISQKMRENRWPAML